MPHDKPRKKKFDFADTKARGTSDNRDIRKAAFLEYFEDFSEFPSYLFDNEHKIDAKLDQTMQDILADDDTSKAMRAGVEELLRRLPS